MKSSQSLLSLETTNVNKIEMYELNQTKFKTDIFNAETNSLQSQLFIEQFYDDTSIKSSCSDQSFSSLFSIASQKNSSNSSHLIKKETSTQTELNSNFLDLMLNFIQSNILLFKAFHLNFSFNNLGSNLKRDIENQFSKFLENSKTLNKQAASPIRIEYPKLTDGNCHERQIIKRDVPGIQGSKYFQNFQKQNVLLINELKKTIQMRNLAKNKNR